LSINPGKIGRIILSLLLAFVLWAFVSWENDPERTRTFSAIPIEAVDVPEDLLIVGSLPTVRVQLRGPESVVQRLDSAMLVARVSLAGVAGSGLVEVDVQVDTPEGVRKVTIEPNTVVVELDQMVSETWPITFDEPEALPPNLTSITFSTEEVLLAGSRADMERVAEVRVAFDLDDRDQSFGVDLMPQPVDDGGVVVPGIEVQPETIRVDVQFETRQKSVRVIAMCACESNQGLEIQELDTASPIPSAVTIAGPESLLESIESIQTEPIDISGLGRSGFVSNVVLDDSTLPEGVTLERRTVDVYVDVPDERLVFNDVPIQVIGLDASYTVNLSETVASFEVAGPEAVLAEIENTPPIVLVDASGQGEGTYTLPVRVLLPPELRYQGLQPTSVQVVISLPPTPTPTPQPASTPQPAPTQGATDS
jgi:YbbR domain-containing protein